MCNASRDYWRAKKDTEQVPLEAEDLIAPATADAEERLVRSLTIAVGKVHEAERFGGGLHDRSYLTEEKLVQVACECVFATVEEAAANHHPGMDDPGGISVRAKYAHALHGEMRGLIKALAFHVDHAPHEAVRGHLVHTSAQNMLM